VNYVHELEHLAAIYAFLTKDLFIGKALFVGMAFAVPPMI